MQRYCLTAAVVLVAAPLGASSPLKMTVYPPNPRATTPVTLRICRDFSDSCYSYGSASWSFSDTSTIRTELTVWDLHRPYYHCATVITPICGDYALGTLSPGRYTVEASMNTACAYISPYCSPATERATFCFDVGPAVTIWEARRAQHGTDCDIRGAIVTASFADGFYIQDSIGLPGLFVRTSGQSIPAGSRVDVSGKTALTSGAEKCIDALAVQQTGASAVPPVRVGLRDVGGGDWLVECSELSGQRGVRGGEGLSNIGLYVSVIGWVTHVDSAGTYFTIADGASAPFGWLADPEGNPGVRVKATGQAAAPVGSMVKVTGTVSCYTSGSDLYPLVRVGASDPVAVLP